MRFAQFLTGSRGRLFSIGVRPATNLNPDRWILVVPPLFEELNKSRRTLSLLGQALAERGQGCFLVDLYGTGDSEGEIQNASWDTWIADLTRARTWLLEQGSTRVDLLAVRGGALLAWDWLATNAFEAQHLILWQPVLSGRQLAHHLLRLRLAAERMGRGSGETAASLREQLARDGSIEIAGYHISAALLTRIEGVSLGMPELHRVGGVDWYQVISVPGLHFPPPVDECARTWSEAGIRTEVHAIEGDAFWSTQEIVEGMTMVTATMRQIEDPEVRVGVC